ncbi:MAG: four helix bundle protein [Chloroflexi bacterium]|nr:four helix bundle protein [Chloroflexota bacterium]
MMDYSQWENTVPEALKRDSVWKIEAYRLAEFVADVAWPDVTVLMRDRRTLDLSGQLYEALGSIGANLAEGYSRGSNKDRVRFYEYSLGSTRESKSWYFKGRHVLGQSVLEHRLKLLNQITWLLLKMIPEQRGYAIREEGAVYETGTAADEAILPLPAEEFDAVLKNIPLP